MTLSVNGPHCEMVLTSVMRTGERVLEPVFADDRWSLALVVRTPGVRLFSSGVDRLLPLSSSEGVSYSDSLDKLFCGEKTLRSSGHSFSRKKSGQSYMYEKIPCVRVASILSHVSLTVCLSICLSIFNCFN